MGSLRRSYAKVRVPLELQFSVVRGVGRGIGGDEACSQITLGNLVTIDTGAVQFQVAGGVSVLHCRPHRHNR